MSSQVDFPVFDADNHYYEAEDAFIRHVPRALRKRCMQWAVIDGKKRLLVGGSVNRFIPNPTWDPVAKPGSLQAYFRGRNGEGVDVKTMFGELDPLSSRPEYQDRDARLRVMDEQGVEGALFFPTLGVGMQQSLAGDHEALIAAFKGFNRWMAEDWGFAYKGRIFAAPMLTLVDIDAAVAEVDWCAEQGARMVCMVPGPVPTATGSLSPAWPTFDRVWQRIEEHGLAVGIHGGDAGHGAHVSRWQPTGEMEAFRGDPFSMVISHNRTIYDTMAAFVCHGLFDRFPKLRVASIETGGMYVPPLIEELTSTYRKMPQEFRRNPVDSFKEHVWVSPYYEDDIALIAELIGVTHVLFGSDYPHAEGLENPTDFIHDIPKFAADDVKLIMRDNGWSLVRPAA